MKRRATVIGGPAPGAAVGEVTIGGVAFTIHEGLAMTERAVELRHLNELRQAYRGLAGCDGAAALRLSFAALRGAVGGTVQEAWYRHHQKPIPPRVVAAQQQRLATANAEAAGPADVSWARKHLSKETVR